MFFTVAGMYEFSKVLLILPWTDLVSARIFVSDFILNTIKPDIRLVNARTFLK